MGQIYGWFNDNLDIVLFVYGLSFIIMGVSIWASPKKETQFKLGGIFWLLASYAFIHAIGDFLHILTIAKGISEILHIVQGIHFVSYIFLFEFGRRLIGFTGKKVSIWILPVLAIVIAATAILSEDFWVNASILTGYFIRFPAGIMAGLGFIWYYRAEAKTLGLLKMKKFFYAAGISCLLWAFFCGIVRERSQFLLAIWLNLETFQQTLCMPVYLFRTICAIILTACIVKISMLFTWEKTKHLQNALLINKSIADAIKDRVLLLDKDFKILWANQKHIEIYGDTPGDTCYHVLHKLDTPCQQSCCPLQKSVKTTKSTSVIHTHLDCNGNKLFVELTVHPIVNDQGEIVKFVHLTRDITESKKAEDALKESEQRLSTVIEASLDAIIAINEEGNIVLFNSAGENLFLYSSPEVLNKSAQILLPDLANISFNRSENSLLKGIEQCDVSSKRIEQTFKRKDGSTFRAEVAMAKSCKDKRCLMVASIHDITNRKKLEAQFWQAQKMEAIGRLAGGVAHDFNNLLTVIFGNAELLLLRLNAGDYAYEKINIIKEAAERAAQLTRQLLTFSRKHTIETVILNLNTVISNLSKMFSRLVGEDVECCYDFQPNLSSIKADVAQIEQVIMNLVVNARDAMLKGGKVSISTKNVLLDKEYSQLHTGVVPGTYVLLSIADTGIGMSSEVLNHLFEPFFTTKTHGTGLGLATVYGIVKQFDGTISVESEVGKGSIFKVYFPALSAQEAGEAKSSFIRDASIQKGAETILVVEDELRVRELAVGILESAGYRVFSAFNADEALRLAKEHDMAVELLVTDVILPGRRGPELAQELKKLSPRLKVMFMSGYTDDAFVPSEIYSEKNHFLAKPFTPIALARKVREILES